MSERRGPSAPVSAGAAAFAVALVLSVSACAAPHPAGPTAPVPGAGADAVAPYIVVLDEAAAAPAAGPAAVADQHAGLGLGGPVDQVYSHALDGYRAEMTATEAALLRADARVAFVEPDRTIQIEQLGPPPAQQVPTGVRRIFADRNPVVDIDGLDDARIDVDVAVIDTGIADLPELNVASRADCTQSAATLITATCADGVGADDNGHGTHVAGTIGAIDDAQGVVGVAPGARLHSVKVCGADGQCLLSAMIAGVDWVTAHADVIEVANMSLAGRGSSVGLDQALTAAVDAGVVPVVAAGNSRFDAAAFFPGNHPDVITVSAVADGDGVAGGLAGTPACRPRSTDEVLADFSNFGPAIDIAAPGVCILSTSPDGSLATMSGTSMAAPHVSGAAALLARGANDPIGRDDVLAIRQRLIDTGNLGWFDDSGDGIQEPLLDVTSLQ